MSIRRTADQRRADAAMLLALWGQAAARPREDAGDKLWQMKIAFLAAHRLRESRLRALNISFYRWTWGPMSNEVYEAWTSLERAKLIESEEHIIFTRDGAALAREFWEEALGDERNAPIRAVLAKVADKWRTDQPAAAPVMQHVYALELPTLEGSSRAVIRDIAKGVDLLFPLSEREAEGGSLYLDGGWQETLALLFPRSASTAIDRGEADFLEGRMHVA